MLLMMMSMMTLTLIIVLMMRIPARKQASPTISLSRFVAALLSAIEALDGDHYFTRVKARRQRCCWWRWWWWWRWWRWPSSINGVRQLLQSRVHQVIQFSHPVQKGGGVLVGNQHDYNDSGNVSWGNHYIYNDYCDYYSYSYYEY